MDTDARRCGYAPSSNPWKKMIGWTALTEEELPLWMETANLIVAHTMPRGVICPSCNTKPLRYFMQRHSGTSRGALWLWCASCWRWYHATCLVPHWWVDVHVDRVEELGPVPEILEEQWARIAGVNDGVGWDIGGGTGQ